MFDIERYILNFIYQWNWIFRTVFFLETTANPNDIHEKFTNFTDAVKYDTTGLTTGSFDEIVDINFRILGSRHLHLAMSKDVFRYIKKFQRIGVILLHFKLMNTLWLLQ